MFNEYENLKNVSINSLDHKKWLLMEYPWLKMGEEEADVCFDLEEDEIYTFIDCAPSGWAKLCEDLCAELKPLLEKVGYVDKYKLCQVKEKFGGLRWYDNGVPTAIYDEYSALLHKYEDLSYKTCCVCGAPASYESTGWISPFCECCATHIGGSFIKLETGEKIYINKHNL